MRINMIKKLCIINNAEDLETILKGIEPMLKNKKRGILLMGGNYEEVKMETEKAIITFMTSMPKVTMQIEKVTTQAKEDVQAKETIEAEQIVKTRGVGPTIVASPTIAISSPIAVSPSYSFE